jgi:hypothetical protein
MTEALLDRLSASPDAFVQKIDLTRDAALLVQLTESAYRAASFLDDRILTPGLNGGWTRLSSLIDQAGRVRAGRPLHFIFHSGHVGSTLVSRLLDESECVLSLREPLALRNLADARDAVALPESLVSAQKLDSLQRAMLQLWSRGYERTHSVVLKATSSTGRLAPSLLRDQPAARAIYLNLAAEPYLATLLAGKNSVVDMRGHGPVRIRQLQSRVSAPLTALHALSPGELAAMSWLAETWNHQDARALFGGRVAAVDFEEFLADVGAGMRRIVDHFQLPVESRWLAGIARSPVLARYSKSPEFEFSPQVRRELLRESRQTNAEQIAAGLRWLEQLAASHPGVAELLRSASRQEVH